jgi:hypothetical protein
LANRLIQALHVKCSGGVLKALVLSFAELFWSQLEFHAIANEKVRLAGVKGENVTLLCFEIPYEAVTPTSQAHDKAMMKHRLLLSDLFYRQDFKKRETLVSIDFVISLLREISSS